MEESMPQPQAGHVIQTGSSIGPRSSPTSVSGAMSGFMALVEPTSAAEPMDLSDKATVAVEMNSPGCNGASSRESSPSPTPSLLDTHQLHPLHVQLPVSYNNDCDSPTGSESSSSLSHDNAMVGMASPDAVNGGFGLPPGSAGIGSCFSSSVSSGTNCAGQNQVGTVRLRGIPIVSLVIDGKERLCLAQISNTLLKHFSYNEIHNRRVALGITCVQCTPVQLEILRRYGAMPISSRRCGMITKREAERLVTSFLDQHSPPKLPETFAFDVAHSCGWGCRGSFVPARYNSSRAKCIRCAYCQLYLSPNKFIFHFHRTPNSRYHHPDAANFNSWRRHLVLDYAEPSEQLVHAWEDVKAMFNGGSRKRLSSPVMSAFPVRKTSSSGPDDHVESSARRESDTAFDQQSTDHNGHVSRASTKRQKLHQAVSNGIMTSLNNGGGEIGGCLPSALPTQSMQASNRTSTSAVQTATVKSPLLAPPHQVIPPSVYLAPAASRSSAGAVAANGICFPGFHPQLPFSPGSLPMCEGSSRPSALQATPPGGATAINHRPPFFPGPPVHGTGVQSPGFLLPQTAAAAAAAAYYDATVMKMQMMAASSDIWKAAISGRSPTAGAVLAQPQHPHNLSPLDSLWPRHLTANPLAGLGLGNSSLTDLRNRLQQQLDFATAAAAAASATRTSRSNIERLVDKLDNVPSSGCSTTAVDMASSSSGGSSNDVCLNNATSSTSSAERRRHEDEKAEAASRFSRRETDELANRKSFSAFRLIGGCDDENIKPTLNNADRTSTSPRYHSQLQKTDVEEQTRQTSLLSATMMNDQLAGIDRHGGQSTGVLELDGNGNRCCSAGKDSAGDAKYSANEGSVSSTCSLKSIEIDDSVPWHWPRYLNSIPISQQRSDAHDD